MSTDLLERMKAALAQAAAREWQTPVQEEINLATVSHEDLGLDPYNYNDPLVRKIYEASEPKMERIQNTPTTVSEPGAILQPDLNGEFPTPLDGALWMAVTYGIPQVPLRGKAPFLPNWPDRASADPEQIRRLAAEYPECNFGSVAFAGKHFIFEADSVAVRERFKNQNPGHDFTSHLIIESSPGKGHRYYLSAPGVENIGQNQGEDYSIRADGEQCVSPGSIHPVTQRQYRVVVHNGPLSQPTAEEIL
ncbi:MAG TPA: bifunctional DNA primase/polymerase, partial [Chthoniobacterales bacterium]|nr:bifunctional DNA primase/polymerase [Chthoniobacterales bacterium]